MRDQSEIPDLYPIEIAFPDIDVYRDGGTGIDWITSFDSGRAGPHVMLTALAHGNEPCGAVALDWLLSKEVVRPERGRLSLGFMNVEAYTSFERTDPMASRFLDEDFNRVWSAAVLDGPRRSRELERARAVRPFLDTVDLLLDIHSMQHRVPPLMLSGPLKKGRDLALRVCVPAFVVADKGHAAGPRMRDYGDFSRESSPKNALLVECGQHWEAEAGRLAIETAIRFLEASGVVGRDFGADFLAGCQMPAPQRVIEVSGPVTIGTDSFRFTADYRGMEVIGQAGTIIAHDGTEPIRTPYDDCVLIMPSRTLRKGSTAVRYGRYMAGA